MELAGRVDPEERHAILDRFFQIHAAGVHRFEGMVDQHTGDGIMAFFGVPIAHENDAEQTERILSMRGQRMPVSHSIRTAVKEPSDTVTARAGGSDIAPGQLVTSISY
jgi:class 3 adenylate cyclase